MNTTKNRTIVFEAPDTQFNRYCDYLLSVLVDSGVLLSDWTCQESRVEVLEQVDPESLNWPRRWWFGGIDQSDARYLSFRLRHVFCRIYF